MQLSSGDALTVPDPVQVSTTRHLTCPDLFVFPLIFFLSHYEVLKP